MKTLSQFRFVRSSLRRRIVLLVGLGMVALAAILGFSTIRSSQELFDRALSERQRLAEVLAEYLDQTVKTNLVVLQEVALAVRTNIKAPDADLKALRSVLREAYLRSFFTEGTFLLDRAGELILIEPQRFIRPDEDFASLRCTRTTLDAGKPQVSGLVAGSRRRIYATVPVRDWNGEIIGAVGGELDPDSQRFRSLLRSPGTETTYIDLVDDDGTVLLSTKSARAFTKSDHGRFLADLIQKGKPVVSACHNCHEDDGGREREVMAFAPLRFAPWGVGIRQSEQEALASAFTLNRRLLSLGLAILLIALPFAWGVARSVTRPLTILTQATQRIAKGDLDQAIPPFGEDEIGQLAQSFDRMRAALKTSLETIEQGKRDLEIRVRERTRELAVANDELQEKELRRHELLKKLISAQEEERKRIARQLHDETSQASAALLLAIEVSGKDLPEEMKEKLRRMKVMADRILDSIHRIIFDLRPSMLDDLGLPSALRFSAESHLEPHGLDLTIEVAGTERRLRPEIETTLYRIGQEAIANIERHSDAESVKITLDFGADEIALHVEDDGRGFDPDEFERPVTEARGLGLLGMRERAALLGGTLAVRSEPGKGSCISVRIPLLEETSTMAEPHYA